MKQLTGLLIAFVLLTSCGVESDKFRLTGRLRNMNQGEFWIYSTDGGIDGIDTILVRDGRFTYETPLRRPATFVIVFPNYSEQPVFAEPGEEVDIKGNASHMKELLIRGTDENNQMTDLRLELNNLMPPEVPKAVATFIKENPESRVGIYLLQRYFLNDPQTDYQQASQLVALMLKEQPNDGLLIKWKKELEGLKNAQINSRLPAFSATDIKGRIVSQNDLKAKANVVTAWATWNYRSTDIQRRLEKLKKEYGDKLGVVSICLDADPKECKRRIERDSLKWKTVCDGRLWQSPLLTKLGITDVPGNLVIDSKGNIVERNLSLQKLDEEIKNLIK